MATALAADTDRNIWGNFVIHDYPVTASTTIYKGQLVGLTDGYLIGASDATTVKFVGRAREGVTCGTTAGAVKCGVATFGGTIIDVYITAGLTLNTSAYGLADMYVYNNDTVAPISVASSCFVGTCIDIVDATNKIVSVLLKVSKAG